MSKGEGLLEEPEVEISLVLSGSPHQRASVPGVGSVRAPGGLRVDTQTGALQVSLRDGKQSLPNCSPPPPPVGR